MDNAFKSAPFPAYTDRELMAGVLAGRESGIDRSAMLDELRRREHVRNGDVAVMTDGERLRFNRTGKAR